MMSEHFDGYSKQRKVFSKGATPSSYQTMSSASVQTAAFRSKGGPSPYLAPVIPPPVTTAPPPTSSSSSSTSGTSSGATDPQTTVFSSVFGWFGGSSSTNPADGKK
jgi:hypothetical protein